MDSLSLTERHVQPLPRRWTTMWGSALVHGALVGGVIALTAFTTTIVLPTKTPAELTFVRVAPPPPPPPRVPLKMLPPVVKRDPIVVPPPVEHLVVPPPVVKPEPVPAPPEPKREQPVVPEPIKPPAPQVTVGSFAPTGNSVRAVEVARPVQAAGFDALSARAPELQLAKAAVGSFDQASGSAQPRPGTDRANVVGDAGFGSGTATGRGRGGAGGVVTSGGFGGPSGGGGGGPRPAQAVKGTDFDAKAERDTATQPVHAAVTETPIQILSKPTPVYTDEARAMRIEGEVLLEVEFTAAGEIRVVRVVRGLGHGLDESAMRAVQSMRFKPAQRNGAPVDVKTTVNIVFRLA